MGVAVVTVACTCMLLWLLHCTHGCRHGHLILHMYVAMITAPCTCVSSWLSHHATCMLPKLLWSHTCMLPWLCWSCTFMLLRLPHHAHICCHGHSLGPAHMYDLGYRLLHTYVAVVTASCTCMSPWLSHHAHVCCRSYRAPAHICCHGHPLGPAHTCDLGYPGHAHVCCRGSIILHTYVAMVTPSCTHV